MQDPSPTCLCPQPWRAPSPSCLPKPPMCTAQLRAGSSQDVAGAGGRYGFEGRILSLCHTHIPNPTARQHQLQTAQQHVHFGVKRCIFSGLPLRVSPAGVCPGFMCAGMCSWAELGGTLPSKPIQLRPPAPATLPRSTAALSYKILCCSNRWEKKQNPRAVHAGSSSACNDCQVMDLHGDNFELLSALKPCSLLCAGNEMCWLLPVSRCRCWLERGRGVGLAAQQRWAVLEF